MPISEGIRVSVATKNCYIPCLSLLTKGLTHKEVVEASKNAHARWFDLGIELGIEVDTLKVLYTFYFETMLKTDIPKLKASGQL